MFVEPCKISEVSPMDLSRRFSSDLTSCMGAASSSGATGTLVTSDSDLCPLHQRDFSLWCLECSDKICLDCVTRTDKMGHGTHIIMPLQDKINYDVKAETTRRKGLLEMVKSYSARYSSYMATIMQCFDRVRADIKINNDYNDQEYSAVFPQPREYLKFLKYENSVLEEMCTSYPFQNLILEKLIPCSEVVNPEQLKLIVDQYVASHHLETRKLDLGFTSTAAHQYSALLINLLTVQRYIFDRKKKEMAEYIALASYSGEPETPTASQLSARTSICSTSSSFSSSASSSLVRAPPSNNPRFFFDIAMGSSPQGRIIIETYPSMAPRMAANFEMLTTGEFVGLSYRNCTLSQLWQFESIITGSFRYGDKTEGRSVFTQEYFRPDESSLAARRGAVGMRRIKKTSENKGLVGSQFRIILNHQKQFTGIFGQVIFGLEYIDAISTFSNTQGQPTERFYISDCGRYEG